MSLVVLIISNISTVYAAKAKNKKVSKEAISERVKLSGFLVRGRLPKPQAMYIIHKSSAEIYEKNPLEEDSGDFSKKILKTVNDKTFKEEEQKWADH